MKKSMRDLFTLFTFIYTLYMRDLFTLFTIIYTLYMVTGLHFLENLTAIDINIIQIESRDMRKNFLIII